MTTFACDCPERPLAHRHDCLISRLRQVERELDAYKLAKQENDDRFMKERDAAIARVESLEAARSAYASEFDGDVSNIHQNIRNAIAAKERAERERDNIRASLTDGPTALEQENARLMRERDALRELTRETIKELAVKDVVNLTVQLDAAIAAKEEAERERDANEADYLRIRKDFGERMCDYRDRAERLAGLVQQGVEVIRAIRAENPGQRWSGTLERHMLEFFDASTFAALAEVKP